MTPRFPAPAWLVGCGNMAGAMVEGWRAAGTDLSGVTVIRPSGKPVEGVTTVTSYPVGETPHFVMLGFKPQKLDEIAPQLAPHIGPDTVLVSMLAGVSVASLRARFAKAKAIVRIMPNLPVAQVQGVVGIYSVDGDEEELAEIRSLMALGMVIWCRTEEELGVIGAVAAAGVAYVARFVTALANAGEELGLRPVMAQMVAEQTLIGTSEYARLTATRMDEIARRVASPNGTTEAGLAVLDGDGALDRLVEATIAAAIARGRQLAEEAAGRS